MASLRETKNRINSVQNTLKITSAMKLIASAKFHQAQLAVKKVQVYDTNLHGILAGLFEGRDALECAFTTVRPLKRIAIVPFSSDTGLCGSYNANVLKEVERLVEDWNRQGVEVVVYPVGEKITHGALKAGFPTNEAGRRLLDKPSLIKCKAFGNTLMKAFQAGEIDRVDIVYHRLKSVTKQLLTQQTMLPYVPDPSAGVATPQDLVTEPSPLAFLRLLFPQVMTSHLYLAVSESIASEHAARMTAMQIATDNGNELLKELTKLYNKTRQQAITNEILDLVGGRARKR
ncbi:MAG: ATP synthase F1 subunit gamma [Bacteroidales bacterium]|nr:ATP synthase F1 subunit gamma [Bacteroidales bacterium]